MISYAFDLYPRTDPLGARLVRLSYTGPTGPLQLAEYRGEANGTGSGQFSLRADSAIADFIDPEGLQYVRVVRIDDSIVDGATDSGFDELVDGGFFTERGEVKVLDDNETKLLTFKGAGPLTYLSRAVMDADSWLTTPFIGTDPQPDGTWPLHLAGTGNELGAILWRVLRELEEAGRHQNPLPAMSIGFTHLVDSNGAPWVRTTGDFVAQVADSVLLPITRRLMEMGLYVEVDCDTFEVRAYEPGTHRRDRTGASWAADVVRFQVPIAGDIATGNIKSDLTRALEAKIRRNAILVGSADSWLWVDDPAVTVPWEGGYILDDEDGTSLLKVGEAQLEKRNEAGDTARLRIKLGDDPLNGRYKPFESDGVQLDDLVTVHTGTGQWDYDEADFPVAALTVSLRPGGDWDCWADLGAAFLSMEQRDFQAQPVGPHTHPPNPKLCPPTTEGSAAACGMDPTLMTLIPTPNGDWEMGDGTNWTTGTPTAGDPEGVGGSWFFVDLNGVGPGGLTYDALSAMTFIGGQTYVAYVYTASGSTSLTFDFGQGAAGGPMSGDFVTMVTTAATLSCLSWTPSANRTGVRIALSRPGSGTIAFDNVRVYTGGIGANPLHGTSPYASRCDHVHHVLSANDPTVNDDADAGYPITTLWTNTTSDESFLSTDDSAGAAVWDPFGGTSGPDLTGINFLVGTASGDLSAEIVVGATPGGELGNTWASPTVDATHSGSTHSAATDTHIADAVDAHDASAISFSPTGTIAATDVQAAIAEVASEAGGSFTLTVEDEGTPLATGATTLDFVGAGVVATGAGAEKTITISGASVADILDLPTAEMDDTLVLAPDGAGGVEFRAETGGGGSGPFPLGMPFGSLERSYTFDSTVESWTTTGGTLSATGGRLRLATAGEQHAIEPSGAANVADGEVQAFLNTVSGNGNNLTFRVTDSNNLYLVEMLTTTDLVSLYKKVAGGYTQIGGSSTFAIEESLMSGYQLKVMVRFVGSRIKIYLEERLVLTANDTAHTTGRVGMSPSGAATGEIDTVRVYSITTETQGAPGTGVRV